jgi:hypothetical protein
MVESNDLYDMPARVAERLEPVLPRLNEVLKHEPDFPHQAWHTQAVVRDAVYAARLYDLSREEIELTRLVAESHDEGYRLVRAGFLRPEEHHLGSYLIAKSRYSDLTIAKGALLHNQDVMPQDVPFAFILVRDIDRLQSMGWGGVIRAAYYLGFRPVGMTEDDPEKNLKAAALFEERTPDQERTKTQTRVNNNCFPASVEELVMKTDFERRAKIYAWNHIFPFLYQNGTLDKLGDLCSCWLMAWEEGGEVEPIDGVLQRVFGAKFFNTYDAQQAISEWKRLHPNGVKSKLKNERQWARETYWHA